MGLAKRSVLFWGAFTSILVVTPAASRADFGILIPEIIIEEIGDPTYLASFDVIVNPGTLFRRNTTDGFTISGVPEAVIGASSSVAPGWNAPLWTDTSYTFRKIGGDDFSVPVNGVPTLVGTFSFQIYSPVAIDFPAFFSLSVTGVNLANNQVTTISNIQVPVRVVPEPEAMALLTLGLMVVGWRVRHQQRVHTARTGLAPSAAR